MSRMLWTTLDGGLCFDYVMLSGLSASWLQQYTIAVGVALNLFRPYLSLLQKCSHGELWFLGGELCYTITVLDNEVVSCFFGGGYHSVVILGDHCPTNGQSGCS